jgi:hypothetical protein
MTNLREYVRHAELHGVEDVYSIAEEEALPAAELGRLPLQLGRIDRRRVRAEKAARVAHRIEAPLATLSRAAGRGRANVGDLLVGQVPWRSPASADLVA